MASADNIAFLAYPECKHMGIPSAAYRGSFGVAGATYRVQRVVDVQHDSAAQS